MAPSVQVAPGSAPITATLAHTRMCIMFVAFCYSIQACVKHVSDTSTLTVRRIFLRRGSAGSLGRPPPDPNLPSLHRVSVCRAAKGKAPFGGGHRALSLLTGATPTVAVGACHESAEAVKQKGD